MQVKHPIPVSALEWPLARFPVPPRRLPTNSPPTDLRKEGAQSDQYRTIGFAMVRRGATPTLAEPTRPRESLSVDDEAAVRTYLRLLVEAPLRSSDRLGPAETPFVDLAAECARRPGSDPRTLPPIRLSP